MKTKKELKQEYRNLKPQMGVFLIRNRSNNKIFIDGHTDISARSNRHKAQLRFNSHKNKELQHDWNEIGADQFEIEIISELKYEENKEDYSKDVQELIEMYKDELQPYAENGYHLK